MTGIAQRAFSAEEAGTLADGTQRCGHSVTLFGLTVQSCDAPAAWEETWGCVHEDMGSVVCCDRHSNFARFEDAADPVEPMCGVCEAKGYPNTPVRLIKAEPITHDTHEETPA